MYRVKDLKHLDIYDCLGRKLGSTEDVVIDYYEKKVKGFITTTRLFSKKNYVALENILTISNSIVTKRITLFNGITFNEIRNFDIINKNGDMIGIIEDLIINEEDFSIRGIIIAEGLFQKFLNGKKILLIEDTILGENSILYFGSMDITLKSLPHNFFKKVKNYG